MPNSPFGFVGSDPEAANRLQAPRPSQMPKSRPGSRVPRPRRELPPRGVWEQLGPISDDPADVDHYRDALELQQRLADDFDVRPHLLHPTKDRRGVVKLSLPDLYALIFEDDDQPELLITSDDPEGLIRRSKQRIAAVPRQPGGQFNDNRSRLHTAELEDMRRVLAEEFNVYPRSAVCTRDMRGRVELTFDELALILDEADEED